MPRLQSGVVYAVLAYVWWGLFPLYFTQVRHVAAPEVLVHRIVWSLALLLAALAVQRRWAWVGALLHQPKVLGAFVASALLLTTNWLTYIWSVQNGHLIDASLGYFITPLINVLFGYTLLHERPRRGQWIALGFAAAGVVWLTVLAGQLPWIALVLGLSFGAYGLLRKIAVLGALEGLALETMLLAPPALIALVMWWGRSPASFPTPDLATNFWLLAAGPLTTVPLLLFAAGARRVSMTTLGLLQYIGPSIAFMLGLWVFHEPFSAARLAGFGFIWAALVVYSLDGWRVARRQSALATPTA